MNNFFFFSFLGGIKDCNECFIEKSDAVLLNTTEYIIWVNNTQLVQTLLWSDAVLSATESNVAVPVPATSFPFSRLASSSSNEDGIFYLYHQLDGFTFAEEEFDQNIGGWIPSINITIDELRR